MQMLRKSGFRFVNIFNTACHLLNLMWENHLSGDFGIDVSHLYPCTLWRESSFRFVCIFNTGCHLLNLVWENHLSVDFSTNALTSNNCCSCIEREAALIENIPNSLS
jgi:hypothetical protein